jgi:hypothetical protein
MEQYPPLANMAYQQPSSFADYLRYLQMAGDVVPIRPPLAPANISGRAGQRRNEQAPRPNMLDPANANIIRIYGSAFPYDVNRNPTG